MRGSLKRFGMKRLSGILNMPAVWFNVASVETGTPGWKGHATIQPAAPRQPLDNHLHSRLGFVLAENYTSMITPLDSTGYLSSSFGSSGSASSDTRTVRVRL